MSVRLLDIWSFSLTGDTLSFFSEASRYRSREGVSSRNVCELGILESGGDDLENTRESWGGVDKTADHIRATRSRSSDDKNDSFSLYRESHSCTSPVLNNDGEAERRYSISLRASPTRESVIDPSVAFISTSESDFVEDAGMISKDPDGIEAEAIFSESSLK